MLDQQQEPRAPRPKDIRYYGRLGVTIGMLEMPIGSPIPLARYGLLNIETLLTSR